LGLEKGVAAAIAQRVNSMKLRFVAPLVGMILLAACQSGSDAGPARGAPVIASLAATKSFDDADQAFMTEQFKHAMETALNGQTMRWTNPSSGYQVEVTPTHMYQQADNSYCREFTQTIIARGQPATTHGTSCRQSDGSWQITG
jgi:surface antigen